MFNMLIVPVAMAGFFYYLLRPIVDYLERRKIKRSIGVLMLYFVFAGLCAIFGIVVWPTLREQIENFISNTPFLVEGVQEQIDQAAENQFWSRYIPTESELSTSLTEYMNRIITWISNSINNLITVVSSVVVIIATIPIILYYMLKEGGKLPPRSPVSCQDDTAAMARRCWVRSIRHSAILLSAK